MDHNYNREDTDFDMTSGFNKQYVPMDPSLENMFAPSTPKHMHKSSTPHYDFQGHGPSAYEMFMPDMMPSEAYRAGYQGLMAPDSTAAHIESNGDQFHGAFEEPNEHATNIHQYDSQSTATNATRMQYAEAFAFALLTHYYPASQGYTVVPTSPGLIAKNGINFILAANDKSDIWKDLRKKKANSTNKANRRRAPTKKELERAEKEEQVAKVAEYNHEFAYMANLQWDYISPQDIAVFVVTCETEIRNEKTGVVICEQHPHTYFAIMIDNFDEVPRFSTENTVHRSDILTDALCRGGKVQNGYGMLLYGPRLEFYAFDRGDEWYYSVSDEENGQEPQDIEPKMEVLQSGSQDMQFDLRTMGLDTVGAAFRDVAVREVVYMVEPEVVADENPDSVDGGEDMEEQYAHYSTFESEK
ncbi:uncharacterized protein ALTATR162_LOCUS3331 [Alternaria atra]|uniref:Uncharacterized protein n=1 Tax=Alternaria atra TaxID=119953 RepID=A0A8J2N001_9PLEO|nr:uncharacterized protein ALTATR162_LOCUS3331 [Alternaria atra]CAG5153789.1 unnamed protein product [Alternaria atra]